MRGIRKLTNGKYQIRIWQNGKETKRIVQARTSREAHSIREQLLVESEQPARQRTTLRGYCVEWFKLRRPSLSLSTALGYERHLQKVVAHSVGDLDVLEVNALHLQSFINEQESLAGWTIDGTIRVLKTMFNDLCADVGLAINPAKRLRNPKPKSRYSDESPNMLTAEQLRLFLSTAQVQEPRWYTMLHLHAVTGLRFGELSALRWSDFNGQTIRIRRTQYNGQIAERTKSGKNRTVPVSPATAELLKSHQKETGRIGEGFVFELNGELIKRVAYSRLVTRTMRKAGIDGRLTSHGLRRTANNLLRQRVDGIVLRAITGHVTEAMSEHYSQVGSEEKMAAVLSLELDLKPEGQPEGRTKVGTKT